MRHPGIKLRQSHIIYQLFPLPLLGFNDISRQSFEELKVNHIIWNPIHLISIGSINCFPVNETCNCRNSSKSTNKNGPPSPPITHPKIWSIYHAKLICNIEQSHTKIVHMNDIETMKFHVHNLLISFTIEFILGGSPLDIYRHRWNNVH